MTVHWIVEDLKGVLALRLAFIVFQRIRGNHVGKLLTKSIMYNLDHTKITMKVSHQPSLLIFNLLMSHGKHVGHFTMDNASNNKTCMKELAKLLYARDIEVNVQDRQIMCFPHVTHICVSHIVHAFTDREAWVNAFTDEADHKNYAAAVCSNSVKMGCIVVCIICASGLHYDEFLDMIKTGNLIDWFKDRKTLECPGTWAT